MIVSSALVALFLSDFLLLQQRYSAPPTPAQSSQVESGQLTVTAGSSDTVTSIARGSTHVPMLSLTFAASCDADVSVNSIDLRHVGLGSQQDIDAVYAVSGSQRISNASSISTRDGQFQLRLRRFVIPACEERTLEVHADFVEDAAVAGEHRIVLASQMPVDAGTARVTVQQTSAAALHRTVGYSQGSVTVEVLPLLQRIRYGSDRVVARVRLTAQDEDQVLSAIRFTNEGSAHGSDLQQLFLATNGGERVSGFASSLEGDQVFLTLSPPFFLEENEQYMLELHADVHVGSSTTVGFSVEEPADVVSRVVRGRSRLR